MNTKVEVVSGYDWVASDGERVRVQAMRSGDGVPFVQAHIAILPLALRERDALVVRALRLAAGRIVRSSEVLALRDKGSQLVLQQVLPTAGRDNAYADFARSVLWWRRKLREVPTAVLPGLPVWRHGTQP